MNICQSFSNNLWPVPIIPLYRASCELNPLETKSNITISYSTHRQLPYWTYSKWCASDPYTFAPENLHHAKPFKTQSTQPVLVSSVCICNDTSQSTAQRAQICTAGHPQVDKRPRCWVLKTNKRSHLSGNHGKPRSTCTEHVHQLQVWPTGEFHDTNGRHYRSETSYAPWSLGFSQAVETGIVLST